VYSEIEKRFLQQSDARRNVNKRRASGPLLDDGRPSNKLDRATALGIGTRTAFSQGFIRDFALVWAEEGLEAVRKVAKKSPEAFVAIAARICPNDVRLTLEQAIPGGMSLEDYSLMREVIAAIREGMPSANQMQPGAVFQHVLSALRD
jgi:hypothetical protein